MVLRGYIDESYNDRVFTLSCILATPMDWAWIESAWKKIIREKNKDLKRSGRTLIARYHAADCSNLKREFKGWNIEEQIAFTKELLAALKKHTTSMVAYSVPMDEFITVFPEHKDAPLPQLYGILVKFIMGEMNSQILDIAKSGPMKPVQIGLFHDRSSHDSIILAAFNQMLSDQTFSGRNLFSSITSTNWQTCIPLQAADLIAYEAFKDTVGKLAGKGRRKSLQSLLDSENFGGRSAMFNRKALEKLRESIGG